jgi:DNA-binding NtrC family response regulator
VSKNGFLNSTLLLISREPASFQSLRSVAQVYAWQIEAVSCGMEALDRMEGGLAPDLVLLDVSPGDTESPHTLRRLHRMRPGLPVLLLSTAADSRGALESADTQPDGFIRKPCTPEELEQAVRRHIVRAELKPDAVLDASDASEIHSLGGDMFYVAASPVMQALRSRAEALAQVDVPVVVVGEYGSGMEATARLIHKLSIRSPFSFLKADCTALSPDLLRRDLLGCEVASVRGATEVKPGKLELGHNGTLLLWEMDGVSDDLLTELLAIGQRGSFMRLGGELPVRTDVRMIATVTAAPEDVDVAAHLERLRRFSTYVLRMPPLRERAEDIPLLTGNFMARMSRRYGLPARQITSRVLEACQHYAWPGNLKELESFVKRYLITGDDSLAFAGDAHRARIEAHDFRGVETHLDTLHGDEHDAGGLKSLVRSAKGETEKAAIIRALEKTRWNRKAAARDLGISYRALLYKIQEYHMSPPEPSVVVINEPLKLGHKI